MALITVLRQKIQGGSIARHERLVRSVAERVVLFAALDEIHKVKKPMPAAHFVEILRRHLNGAKEAQRAAPTL